MSAASAGDPVGNLITHFVKDMFYAEQALLKALPDFAGQAADADLKRALLADADQTRAQIERLREVFVDLRQPAEGVTCEALVGLLQECDDVGAEFSEPGRVRDAGLVACVQAIKHYEVARYETLIRWLQQVGQLRVSTLLKTSLAEEESTLGNLRALAEKSLMT